MTAYDLWKSNPDDQKIAEVFFKGDTGQRLLAVLAEANQLQASLLPGEPGIYEDSKNVQRHEGWRQCLAAIPNLFHTKLHGQQGQQAAAGALREDRRAKLNIVSQQSPAP